MSQNSKIEWTESTWNPLAGCSIVSPGCTNCYAMKMAHRLQSINRTGGSNSRYVNHYDGTTKVVNGKPVWTGKLSIAPDRILTAPLSRKKPTMYFVNSMSDLFHEDVPDEWIDKVFAVMALSPQHTFQVLTKRSARMRAYLAAGRAASVSDAHGNLGIPFFDWPLPNVWLGVSAERQQEADARIPDLLATPAAVRFVSAEPLLSTLDLSKWLHDGRREIILGSGGSRAIQGRAGRHDLALGEVDRWRDRLGSDLHAKGARGEEFCRAEQLPASDVQGRRAPSQDICAPHCVDGDQSSTDPRVDGDQSHRRQQAKQHAIELGTGYASAKRPALPYASCAEEKGPARGQELGGSGNGNPSSGYPLHLGKSIPHAARNCSEISDHTVDGVGHRAAQELESHSLDWVIVGGESGPGARPMHPDWVRSIRDQCTAAGVAFFFKQWGAWEVASDENGRRNGYDGYVMPDTGEQFTWLGYCGRTANPSANQLTAPVWAMAKVGKSRAGRLLDGREWNEMPEPSASKLEAA